MADPRSDPGAYLHRVASSLRLPPDVAAEVLEEVGAHIADTTAGLVQQGLEPDLAQREALGRLGDPTDLAEGIRRAKQTRRRLLAAAGFGAIAGVRGFVSGWLFAAGVTILAILLATLLVSAVVKLLGVSSSGWGTDSSWLTAPYLLFAAGYSGRRVPAVLATRSFRPVRDVRRPVAVVGGGLILVVAVFGLRLTLDAGAVVVLALTGPAFAAGALTARGADDGRFARIRLRGRTVILVVLLTTAGYAVMGFATMRINGADGGRYLDTTQPIGVPALEGLPEDVGSMGGGTSIGGIVSRELAFDPAPVPVGWSGFRLEAWREGPWVDGRGPIPAGETAPVAAVPMHASGDPVVYAAELALPVSKARLTYTIAVTAIGPDGRRYVLAGPDTGTPGRVWIGTAWEWLTTN